MNGFDPAQEGALLHGMARRLYPICRSITGNGFRESLAILGEWVSLKRHEVPSGTSVFDWTVPPEWNIQDAWIADQEGHRVVDFRDHNLHVVSYSAPVRGRMSFQALRPHLYSLPERPDWIPYRTSYYRETWGFCLKHRTLEAMGRAGGEFEVCVDATLAPGYLTYGEYFKPGTSGHEFLISCHSCHPSLANDNLSGMAVTARLAAILSTASTRYSYRFVWIPGTIGAIAWLALNEASLDRIRMGLVVSCVGDPGAFTYKRSRRGHALIDRVVEGVLAEAGRPYRVRDFAPLGYDERQYCSPGINLPMGCLLRTPNGEYPEYHTSADNLALVTPAALAGSLEQLRRVVGAVEKLPPEVVESGRGTVERRSPTEPRSCRYVNLSPKGEPQLGRRGLFRSTGGVGGATAEEALLWVLNLSDGQHALPEIAARSRLSLAEVTAAAARLEACGLLRAEPLGA